MPILDLKVSIDQMFIHGEVFVIKTGVTFCTCLRAWFYELQTPHSLDTDFLLTYKINAP